MYKKNLTRISLLLALALVFQSLRFVIPLPPVTSTFLIGTLVNICLIISTMTVGIRAGILIALVTPAVAYFQGLLPIPPLVFPIIIGNIIYVTVFNFVYTRTHVWITAVTSSLAKSLFIYFAILYLLQLLILPLKAAEGIMFIMSWPQFITAFIGIIISCAISKRLHFLR